MKIVSCVFFILISLIVKAIPENISNLIHVDQFGYRPEAKKIAVLSNPITGYNGTEEYAPGATFEVRNWFNDDVVFSGSPFPWNDGITHSQSGDQIWWFDFSSFNADGSYYIFDPQ
ncbi:MAG: cellulase N-terminal Ig-like domain-containing protein, partial [Flavobacteriales bacterium]